MAATRAEVLRTVEEGGSVLGALEALLRLRQACCDVRLVPGLATADADASRSGPSSKIRLLVDSLETSIEAGHRALVFSQWTSYLDLIEKELKKAKIGFSRLDGTTRDREGVVAEFQRDGGPPVMLLSLKAGGVGLTLTAADHVYITDPWWNPAVENQAADRAHRIGQTQAVLIHRLVAENTVEERVLELQSRKLEIAAAALEGQGTAPLALTREDLADLLR